MHKVDLETGVKAWAFGDYPYVKSAMNNVEEHFQKKEDVFQACVIPQLSKVYHHGVDATENMVS